MDNKFYQKSNFIGLLVSIIAILSGLWGGHQYLSTMEGNDRVMGEKIDLIIANQKEDQKLKQQMAELLTKQSTQLHGHGIKLEYVEKTQTELKADVRSLKNRSRSRRRR